MAKINVLDSNTYNKIAAGEVVEKPASVIKELVENSIDAGAKNIVIKIYGGGIEKIQVSDDGSGIEKDELEKAFLPHATSKIKNASDLESIFTLGFRGEAVASISAVSKMRIASKPTNQADGFVLECNGGVFSELQYCALSDGTVVDVDNLFYNVPVRARFLKSERSETSDISNIVSRIILGNPDISFKYYSNDKLIYQSFGGGEEEAFVAVYGLEALKNVHYINTVKNGISIRGYLGKAEYSKPNKSYQSMFINGRYIVNNTLSVAIGNAYSPYLMKRQYPLYVLNVKIPYEFVDVNVHPNKTDVRFSDNQIIYGSVYSVVSSVLDGTSAALNIVVPASGNSELATNTPFSDVKESLDFLTNERGLKEYSEFTANAPFRDATEESNEIKEKWEYKPDVLKPHILELNDHTHPHAQTPPVDIFIENKRYLDTLTGDDLKTQFDPKNFKAATAQAVQQKIDVKSAIFIGQAFSTYLIFQSGDELFLIDQHAAHERLIYDKIIAGNIGQIIQPMLCPYILELNHREFDFIKGKLELLAEMGFKLEEFGATAYKISELPDLLTGMDIKKFFNEFLSDLNIYKKDSEYLKDKFAQKACKAAVKGGDSLDKSEGLALLAQLGGDFGIKCPHGRPIAIKISKHELEKWFKRIV